MIILSDCSGSSAQFKFGLVLSVSTPFNYICSGLLNTAVVNFWEGHR